MSNKSKSSSRLNNVSIATRIVWLIIVSSLLIGLIGAIAGLTLNKNLKVLGEANQRVTRMSLSSNLINEINSDYRTLLYEVNSGIKTWKDGHNALRIAKASLLSDLDEYLQFDKERSGNAELEALAKAFLPDIDEALRLLKSESHANLSLFVTNDMNIALNPLLDALQQQQAVDVKESKKVLENATQGTRRSLLVALGVSLIGLALVALLGYLIYRSITRPTQSLVNTVKMLSVGEFSARTPVYGKDELAQLGQALNRLLDDRVATLNQVEQNHEQLNNSVFSLLQAVSELSDRNLSVRATVTEDATGPLADAINQLSEDTAEVLGKVQQIAQEVDKTAGEINRHAQSINQVAAIEQAEAEKTAAELDTMSKRFDNIAAAAKVMNGTAEQTAGATRHAHESVSRTLDSMQEIRDKTQDTGKRIKQLGERSQEITHIVDVINTVAERTTVLALNASMQAAAAGDAGRGFSVVAEEIQRLAESSRESTGQIATLIRNIQLETNETIRTMDRTIEQVSEGSKLAKDAGEEMEQAQQTTTRLVAEVAQISEASQQQARAGKALQTRAKRIVSATKSTGERLRLQSKLIENMANYARQLVESVSVFKLGE